jgi:hypothetical protein
VGILHDSSRLKRMYPAFDYVNSGLLLCWLQAVGVPRPSGRQVGLPQSSGGSDGQPANGQLEMQQQGLCWLGAVGSNERTVGPPSEKVVPCLPSSARVLVSRALPAPGSTPTICTKPPDPQAFPLVTIQPEPIGD